MEERRSPALLNQRVDMKYATLLTFNDVLEHIKSGGIPGIPLPAETKTLILTQFGTIEGDIVNLDNDEQEEVMDESNWRAIFFKNLVNGVAESRNEVILDWENQNDVDKLKLINDASYILLSNAVIIPFSTPQARFAIGEMVLFTDQIVGISAGKTPPAADDRPSWKDHLHHMNMA
ncbi:MAG: hypothetical protein U9N81_10740 [Bacillota bacterium]|nr:hypothetical protein [Bacillota bacterium]